MHLLPNVNVQEFLKVVATCEGDVVFETPEGDMMNLKSELCRYVFASNADSTFRIMHGDITCKNPDDATRLSAFLAE